jgi:EAL and modified HD-GYP domain-containing signal transduction protein
VAVLMSLAGAVNKPGDMLRRATERAIMCESLALMLDSDEAAAYFTGGLLSSLDVVLEMPLAQIVASLPLTTDLHAAVLRREGAIGAAIDCAMAMERADWPSVAFSGLTPNQISHAYLSAIKQADEMWAALKS